VLADYKTDTVGERLPELVDYYRNQVDTYRTLWQEMSGEKVKEAGLFFVDGSQWVRV
jgi:ATP-dependent helicase/nuclease subunit A